MSTLLTNQALTSVSGRATVPLAEGCSGMALPIPVEDVARTYREGDNLVVVLISGGEILIESFFSMVDFTNSFTLVVGNGEDGEVAALRIGSEGETVESESIALGRLEEMFGGPGGMQAVQFPGSETAAIFGLEIDWSTNTLLLAGGGLLLGGYALGSGGDGERTVTREVNTPLEFDVNGDGTNEVHASADALATAVRLAAGNVSATVTYDVDGDGTADTFASVQALVDAVLSHDVDGDGTADPHANANALADAVEQATLTYDVDGDGTGEVHANAAAIAVATLTYDVNNDGTAETYLNSAALVAALTGDDAREPNFDLNVDGTYDFFYMGNPADGNANGTPDELELYGVLSDSTFDSDSESDMNRLVAALLYEHITDLRGATLQNLATVLELLGSSVRADYSANDVRNLVALVQESVEKFSDGTAQVEIVGASADGLQLDFDTTGNGTADKRVEIETRPVTGTTDYFVAVSAEVDEDYDGTTFTPNQREVYTIGTDDMRIGANIDTSYDGTVANFFADRIEQYHYSDGELTSTQVETRDDSNGDGTFERRSFDSDGDGNFERSIFDDNNNGTAERIAVDENDDGTVDRIVYDSDENGTAERYGYDQDDDGVFEMTGYDDNEDGIPHFYEVDRDGNGTPEWRLYNSDEDFGTVDLYGDGTGDIFYKIERQEGDVNEDGILEYLILDIDDNGTTDIHAYDANGDGLIDTAIYRQDISQTNPFDFTGFMEPDNQAAFVVIDRVIGYDGRGRQLLRAVDNSFDTTTESGVEVKYPVYGTGDGILMVDGTVDEARVYRYKFEDPVAYDGPAIIEIFQRDSEMEDEAVDAVLQGVGQLYSTILEVDVDGDGITDLRADNVIVTDIQDPNVVGTNTLPTGPADWRLEEIQYRVIPDLGSHEPYSTLRVLPDESVDALYSEELYFDETGVLRNSLVQSTSAHFVVPELLDADGTTDGTTNQIFAAYSYYDVGTEGGRVEFPDDGLVNRIEYVLFDSTAETADPAGRWAESFVYEHSSPDGTTTLDSIEVSVYQYAADGTTAQLNHMELHHFDDGSVARVEIDSVGTDGTGTADGTYDSEETLYYDAIQRVVYKVVDEHDSGTAYDGSPDSLVFVGGLSHRFVPDDEALGEMAGIGSVELAGINSNPIFPALTGEDYNGATRFAISDEMLTVLANGGTSYTLAVDGDANDVVVLSGISRITSGQGTSDAEGRHGYQGTDGIIYVDPDVMVEIV